MKIFLLIPIIIFSFLQKGLSQIEDKNHSKSLSIDFFYIADFGNDKLLNDYSPKGLLINYHNTLFDKNIFMCRLQTGIGFYFESQVDAAGFLPVLKANVFVKNYNDMGNCVYNKWI